MSWIVAIALAAGVFAIAALLLRVSSRGWPLFATALALGLAGYGLQAHPSLPGAPATSRLKVGGDGWALIDARHEMVAEGRRSRSSQIIVADAMARNGRFDAAAVLLRGAIEQNSRDGEAWLALANALVEQADGALTRPAVYAFQKAAKTSPGGLGPGYFFGLALIRSGSILEGRQVWAQTLASGANDAEGRKVMTERLARLDELIEASAAPAQDGG